MIDLRLGDCLDLFPMLAPQSIDAVIADIPYGTTACKWDTVIPFEPMWAGIKRVIKPRGAVVLFGSQPFTSALVMSNPEWFKYEWVWDKRMVSNVAQAKIQPLRTHENVLIFSLNGHTYNPQLGKASKPFGKLSATNSDVVGHLGNNYQVGVGYPKTILTFIRPNNLSDGGFHPTQKPGALMAYLIRTYTNEGDTVLDFTMGSGTTGVACVKTNRNFIGFEILPEYFAIAQKRIAEAQQQMVML